MSTPTNLESILKKIAGLRALAANAGTQAEAEAAASRAEALIAQYQIEDADLDTQSPDDATIDEGEDLFSTEGNREKWRSMLACALAGLHGCYSFCHIGPTTRQRIAGRASDIAIVRYLFGWLCYEIERLAQREHGRAARNAFKLGAACGYVRAMRQAQQEAFEADQQTKGKVTSVAMVLSDRATLSKDHFTSPNGTKMKFRSGRVTLSDPGAYHRGEAAGASLQPSNGLNAGTPPRMLGL